MGHRRAQASQATKARVAKAGKRSGAVRLTEPNPANLEARLRGERQFHLARVATVEVPDLTGKLRAITVPFRWDAKRKAVCFSPSNKKEAHRG